LSLKRRFLYRLGASAAGDDRAAVEESVAGSRALLAAAAALYAHFAVRGPDAGPVVYLALAVTMLALGRARSDLARRAAPILHVVDVACCLGLSYLTRGAAAPALFFPIASAALHWGGRETLITAAGGGGLLVAITAAMPALPRGGLDPLATAALDVALVVAVAAPFARLAEQEKRLRAQVAAVSQTIGNVRVEDGFTVALERVLRDLLRLFGARRALLVAHESGSGRPRSATRERRQSTRPSRLFLWELGVGPQGEAAGLIAAELDPSARDTYLFAAPAEAWYVAVSKSGDEIAEVRALNGEGLTTPAAPMAVPASFREAHPFRSLLAISASFGEDWDDRLFLVDPTAGARDLSFLRTLVRQAGPAIYGVYLLGRLHSRVSADERARVARELHDGITQSLIGLEMQVEAWRRESGLDSAVAEKLSHVQKLLRQDIHGLRELMEQMKPLHLDDRHLLDFVAELVAKFQRETGIHAHFVSGVEQVAMPPQVCSELGRIVQEALVNVRRHAGASNVLVRISADNGTFSLVVDDDGKGFPFSGQYSHADLEAQRKGPLVIKERVRSIGGELAIDSKPGVGARLEVTLRSPAS
jgi:signal transduction histidine kinase